MQHQFVIKPESYHEKSRDPELQQPNGWKNQKLEFPHDSANKVHMFPHKSSETVKENERD